MKGLVVRSCLEWNSERAPLLCWDSSLYLVAFYHLLMEGSFRAKTWHGSSPQYCVLVLEGYISSLEYILTVTGKHKKTPPQNTTAKT